MHLLAKFNLVLITVFAFGLLAVCVVSRNFLSVNAQSQVVQNARIMMETASAMRNYTSTQIKPLLAVQMEHEFLPQSVPAYAATENFEDLRSKYPQYSYKEATLNPTNPRDRATDWEADLVTYFKNNPNSTEITRVRDTMMGPNLYLAHPIRITDPTCLTCHSTPSAAPATMIKRYGSDNGFGWQMGDTVGAQIVSVPMSLPERMANKAFNNLLGSLIIVFLAILIVLNLMMTAMVIRPVQHLSAIADNISRGNVDVEELPVKGKDEISGLAESFNRMQRSLKKAMSMLEEA